MIKHSIFFDEGTPLNEMISHAIETSLEIKGNVFFYLETKGNKALEVIVNPPLSDKSIKNIANYSAKTIIILVENYEVNYNYKARSTKHQAGLAINKTSSICPYLLKIKMV